MCRLKEMRIQVSTKLTPHRRHSVGCLFRLVVTCYVCQAIRKYSGKLYLLRQTQRTKLKLYLLQSKIENDKFADIIYFFRDI